VASEFTAILECTMASELREALWCANLRRRWNCAKRCDVAIHHGGVIHDCVRIDVLRFRSSRRKKALIFKSRSSTRSFRMSLLTSAATSIAGTMWWRQFGCFAVGSLSSKPRHACHTPLRRAWGCGGRGGAFGLHFRCLGLMVLPILPGPRFQIRGGKSFYLRTPRLFPPVSARV
jgi:hypothetical protein